MSRKSPYTGLSRAEAKRARAKPVLPVRTLRIEIRASDTECCSWFTDERKRCPWIRTWNYGTRYDCGLFGGALDGGVHQSETLRRVAECLTAEVEP